MPKQKGTMLFTGSMQNLSFYKNKLHGHVVRTKGGPSGNQIKTGKNFAVTRKNMSEFGRASAYGKRIRLGFHHLIRHCKDGTMNTNLVTRIKEILKMDDKSALGKRDFRKDTLAIFRHFELDSKSLSSRYFELPVNTEIHNGELDVYAGITLGKKPEGVDAWKLVSVAAGIDFVKNNMDTDLKASDVFVYGKGSYGVGFHHYYNEGMNLFHGMCIVFYEYDPVIDDYRPLKADHVNAGFIRYVEVRDKE
jgi:hypothetical protein